MIDPQTEAYMRVVANTCELAILLDLHAKIVVLKKSEKSPVIDVEVGKNILYCFNKENHQQFKEYLLGSAKGVPVYFEMHYPNKDQYMYSWRVSPVTIASTKYFLLTGHPIFVNENSTDCLLDGLGLPTRNATLNYIEKESNLKNATVAVLDIEKFSEINELYDFSVGTELLTMFATMLGTHFKGVKFIGRLGDDQFCVIFDKELDKLQQAFVDQEDGFRNTFIVGTHLLAIEVNVGFARVPTVGETLKEGFQCALFALQHLKNRRRFKMADASQEISFENGYFLLEYSQNAKQQKNKKQRLSQLIEHGFNNGEFRMEYQPIVDTAGKLVSMEALMRWTSVEVGNVSPQEFIEIAENANLIGLVGEWALKYTGAQMMLLPQKYADLKVSVNVSPKQFQKADFYKDIQAVLKLTGLPPSRLKLEITEGVLMENPAQANAVLDIFARMGVQIAIDDFGIGYSSLSSLNTFKFNTLKIDKSFVKPIETDLKSRAICHTIIRLANDLGVNVTAEGVETQEQFKILKDLGCHTFQGWLFGKPSLIEDILKAYP